MSSQKYTRLEDLEDGESGSYQNSDMPDPSMIQNKFIRKTSQQMPMESGMERMGFGVGNYGGNSFPPPSHQGGEMPISHQQLMAILASRPISCIEITEHVQNCPICSKFYTTDSTVYVLLIIILAVVCLMLFKRVLNL